MHPTPRIDGFRGEFLWELEIAERQMMAMVEAIPGEKYDWRPDQKARSISEVLVHVAAGNFMLLEAVGAPAPVDLYGQVPAGGQERFLGLIRRNDEMEKSVREKVAVSEILKRSLQAVRNSVTQADDAELDQHRHFFGEQTTVHRVYLRLLAHTHEHMGQMIAYMRINILTTDLLKAIIGSLKGCMNENEMDRYFWRTGQRWSADLPSAHVANGTTRASGAFSPLCRSSVTAAIRFLSR
jgi:uncharacterized damage-inducible protein DinB